MNKFELLGELQETFDLGIMESEDMKNVLIFAKDGEPAAAVETARRFGLNIPEPDKINKQEYRLLCKLAGKDLSELPNHIIGDTLYRDPSLVNPNEGLDFILRLLDEVTQMTGGEGE